jgi:formylglycine-generating enzyme required for sulfatase activity
MGRRTFFRAAGRYVWGTAALVAAWKELATAEAARAEEETAGPPKALVNSLGMALALIPAGEFTMGDAAEEGAAPHKVTLTKPFYLGVCEVTNASYRQFIEATGHPAPGIAIPERKGVKTWTSRMFNVDDQPVVAVTWDDAVAFCRWLSEKEGQQYRLPTEAEWEYACRAGTATRYSWGDDPEKTDARYFAEAWPESVKETTDFQPNPWGLYTTSPVKRFSPNAWGLYDMAGNVWEWVADWYGPYPAEAQVDPQGPEKGEKRVTRGGSRYHQSRVATAAVRRPWEPNTCCRNRGFRVLRESAGAEPG